MSIVLTRYIADDPCLSLCGNCMRHQTLHVAGKCLFGPGVYQQISPAQYVKYIYAAPRRRFYNRDEHIGKLKCGTRGRHAAVAGIGIVQSWFLSKYAGSCTVSCPACAIHMGWVCEHCGLTRTEHFDGYCIHVRDQITSFKPAYQFRQALKLLYYGSS